MLGELELDEAGGTRFIETEDLVPPVLAVEAANVFFREVSGFRDVEASALTVAELQAELDKGARLFKALNAAAAPKDAHIEKLGFARAVIGVCAKENPSPALRDAIALFLGRTRKLFKMINAKRRDAERASRKESVGTRVETQVKNFRRDHPDQATKEEAHACLENIEAVLDDSYESDAVLARLVYLRRHYELDDPSGEPISSFGEFIAELGQLRHAFALSKVDAPV